MDFTLVIEKSEEGMYIGSVVELPGCYTQGNSIEELLTNIKEAIQLYLEAEKPEIATEFIGIQKVTI